MSSNSSILVRTSRSKLLVFIFIISLLILRSNPVNSEVIWQETFDTVLSEEWNVTHGAVEIQNETLEGTECYTFGTVGSAPICSASIWYNSTALTGTWSLDYYLSNTESSSFLFYFIGEGASSTSGGWPDADYMVFIWGTNFYGGNNININFGYHHNDGEGDRNTLLIPGVELAGWTHIDITRTEEGVMKLYLDGELKDTFTGISPELQSAEHINMQLSIGDKIDNLKYSDTIDPIFPSTSSTISSSTESTSTQINTTIGDDEKSDNSPLLFIGAGVGLSGLVVITRMGFKKKLVRQAVNTAKAIQTIAGTSQNFEVTDYSMLALMAKPHKLSNIESEEFQESIPSELLLYRFLMHPIRLTIMKLLESNDYLPSFEVRQILGISWGEYNSHLKSLESKSYVEIRNSFNEQAQLILTLYITKDGRTKYQELLNLLLKFTRKEAPIRRIVGKNIYPIYDTDLYPSADQEF